MGGEGRRQQRAGQAEGGSRGGSWSCGLLPFRCQQWTVFCPIYERETLVPGAGHLVTRKQGMVSKRPTSENDWMEYGR